VVAVDDSSMADDVHPALVEAQSMTWDQIEGDWARYAESFCVRFEQLTEEEIKDLNGNKPNLEKRIASAYGYSRQEAETHLENWKNSVKDELEQVPTSTSGAPTY